MRTLAWWYWLAMAATLAVELAGLAPALRPALVLGAVQVAHFLLREKQLSAFPVQVRLAYLGLLLIGTWEPLRFIHWIQLAGTTAMVAFNYCPLARALSLAPWNRQGPLTARLVWTTFASLPVAGSVLERPHPQPAEAATELGR